MKAVSVAFLAGLALAGCGSEEDDAPPPGQLPPDAPAAGCSTTADETAWIEPRPNAVQAGEEIDLSVVNQSRDTLTFGVAYEFERRDGEAWAEATEAVYGPNRAFPQIAIVVKPGERYTGGYAATRLPRDLGTGVYRATKQVTSTSRDGTSRSIRICGGFVVT